MDSLFQIEHRLLETSEVNPTKLIDIQLSISRAYYIAQEYSKALDFAEKAATLKDNIEDQELIGLIYYRLGVAHQWLNHYHESFKN